MSLLISLSPYRIIEDAGGAFFMGLLGGTVWHGASGYRSAPSGLRIRSAFSAMRTRAPALGGNFAIWGSSFSMFDCGLVYIRNGREDAYNSIGAGALTGALLAARGGIGSSFRSALVGGVFLAVIEGAGVLMGRLFAEEYRPKSQTT